MKTILKSTLAIALLGLSSTAFSQEKSSETATTTTSGERFGEQFFRTWSFGLNAGITSSNSPFSTKVKEFGTTNEQLAYGAFIKKQVFPAMGLQAEFHRGKVNTLGKYSGANDASGEPIYTSGINNSTQVQWAGAITAVYNIANISINAKDNAFIPYIKAGGGYMSSSATQEVAGVETTASARQDWFIPVGAGVKFALTRGINLDFGYDVNFLTTSKFNGVNGDKFDKYAYAHGGLEFVLGKKDQPQLQNFSSLSNLKYQTKEETDALRAALSTAEQNAQRDRDQYAKDLADDDNDGVANKFDKCAGTAANTVVDGAGCAIKVQREIIKETKVVVTEADRKVVADAIKNLEFDLGKSTIRAKSYTTLNRVAALLVEKNFSLKLAGHTDNTGADDLNMRLSKDRAESIKAYLVSQGANASRIEATGYGETQPIATNKTAAGRQANRRVEFTLF